MNRFVAILTLCLPSVAMAVELPSPDAVFPSVNADEARLGQMLFFDPILSGNQTVSCATCHHPRFATSDGLSLGIGEGGSGLGTERVVGKKNLPEQRIPRNSPALFNLGATEFINMFHDGRVQADIKEIYGTRTPLGEDMAKGFASILSAQAMFPVFSADEMAGHFSENEVAQAVGKGLINGPGGVWEILSKRVDSTPGYRAAFDPVIGTREIVFTDISNVIAAFIASEFRADESPFDAYLRDGRALPDQANKGMQLFYGKAGCSGCHSGQFQTDHEFHAIAMPQIGPGKAEGFETHKRDMGRMRVTGDAEDAYCFRTPSLRNIALTAPYGHSGSYKTLEAVVRHHLDPVASLHSYDRNQAVLPDVPGVTDFDILGQADDVAAIAAANELAPVSLTDVEVDQILAFLDTLTDQQSLAGRMGVPETVPSGLTVDR
jgi:cytochrome c peroxidase